MLSRRTRRRPRAGRRRRRRPVDRGPGRRRHAPLRPRHRRRAVDPQLERHELVGVGLARRAAELRPVGDRAPRRRLRRLRARRSTPPTTTSTSPRPGAGRSGSGCPSGQFNSAPGATYRQGTGEVDVTGVGLNNQLYHGYWAAGQGWSAWGALGGAVSGRPSAISPAPGILDIYLRGANNQLYQKYWTSSTGWGDFILAGRRPDLRRLRDGVGSEPPRHLRPRRRQRDLHQVLPVTQLGQLGAAGRRRELRPRSDLVRPRPP